MPRRPRLVVPDIPLHIIQRGNNRQNCFYNDSDNLVYLDLLRRAAGGAQCKIHAYVLMSNHVHLLTTPSDENGPASMMKAVGERYVRYLNERYRRTGTLWDGRYRSCLIEDDSYLLVCHRYIELNPVRAGMVTHPSLYRWSSHQCNAYAQPNPMITPHGIMERLGADPFARMNAYRQLFSDALNEQQIAKIRDATNYNYACGSINFREAMESMLGRQVSRRSATRA
jgi:putative transposase